MWGENDTNQADVGQSMKCLGADYKVFGSIT